jgi:hypothetical protein
MLSIHRAYHTLGMKAINISTNIITVLCVSRDKNNSRSVLTKYVGLLYYLYSTSNSMMILVPVAGYREANLFNTVLFLLPSYKCYDNGIIFCGTH